MNEEFYSIGRGSLNINGKFYCGLDYQITDFMRNLEEENQQLKEQLQQKEDIINKTKSTINQMLNTGYSKGNTFYYATKDGEFGARAEILLEILDNKGE